MCISVHQLCYVHADKEPLFQNINLIVNTGQRLALVGNNGIPGIGERSARTGKIHVLPQPPATRTVRLLHRQR